MEKNLERFKVLLMVGKGFTPAQQAWPALVLELHAQLQGKRAQRRVLGILRSICWTDHANATRQQEVEPTEIDPKLLRWIAEIVADGSLIRSLAGRSCVLADGTSRNSKDRDALMEQRTKDLKGLCGQVRGFDLDGFLSDYEEPGAALAWTLGRDAWVSSKAKDDDPKDVAPTSKVRGGGQVARSQDALGAPAAAPFYLSLPLLMANAGVAPTVKVLFVPDYVAPAVRLSTGSKLHRDLSTLLPAYHVVIANVEPPFPDDDGVYAHFDAVLVRNKLRNSRLKGHESTCITQS
jgi:hypothetical protein